MNITDLPIDIISILQKDLSEGQTKNIALSCNSFRKYFKKIGYITKVSFGLFSNITFNDYLTILTDHQKTLNEINICNLNNPSEYIFGTWPNKIKFLNCSFTRPISPGENDTASFYSLDVSDFSDRGMYTLEWSKFKNLKILKISTYDVDFTGFEACKDLQVIIIDLKNVKYLPSCISELKNLRIFVTNCKIAETKIVSKNIETFLFPCPSNFNYVNAKCYYTLY